MSQKYDLIAAEYVAGTAMAPTIRQMCIHMSTVAAAQALVAAGGTGRAGAVHVG